MLQVSTGVPTKSTETGRKFLPDTEVIFCRVARAIWPRKTAACLAAAAGVTERTATNWLAGVHEPSAAALVALINAIAGET